MKGHIFLLFRGRRNALFLFFKHEEPPQDFIRAVVEWLFELHVSVTVMDSKSVETQSNWDMTSLYMMDM